jgi:hypothetical protein
MGLLWLLRGRPVVVLTEDSAVIEHPDGWLKDGLSSSRLCVSVRLT